MQLILDQMNTQISPLVLCCWVLERLHVEKYSVEVCRKSYVHAQGVIKVKSERVIKNL